MLVFLVIFNLYLWVASDSKMVVVECVGKGGDLVTVFWRQGSFDPARTNLIPY